MAPAVPLAARGGAARSGAAAAPPPPHGSLWARARSWAARYLHWARGYALWALYNAVGAALATPLLIRHLGQLLLRCDLVASHAASTLPTQFHCHTSIPAPSCPTCTLAGRGRRCTARTAPSWCCPTRCRA